MSEGSDTAPAFDQLTQLVLSDPSLDSVMTAIAEVSKRLLPSAVEASVTLVRGGKTETMASTGPLALQMDEAQYKDGAGPCLAAAQSGEIVSVPDATTEQRWPLFAAAARERGVGSSLSLPMRLPDPVAVGLNLYSDRPGGFSDQDVELAQALAAYAAVALANVHLYEAQKRVAEHLEQALESRGVIDQAKGILMSQRRCSEDAAFQLLVEAAQRADLTLRQTAEQVIADLTKAPSPDDVGPVVP